MPHRQFSRINPKRYLVHAINILGRRGIILILLGIVWISQGVSIIILPTPSPYLLLDLWDPFRAIGWVVTGGVAIAFARTKQGFDAFGFLALYVMGAYRILAYLYNFALWTVGNPEGNSRGIIGVFSWLTIIILIMVIAGWREEEKEERK